MRVHHLGALDDLELRVEQRRGLGARQRVVGILDVGGGDRVAVGEARGRVDVEGRRQAVGRDLHVVGDQRVLGGEFVPAALHQRVEHQVLHVRCGRAAHQERIERVVALRFVVVVEVERAVVRRVRVRVVEVREVGRVFRRIVLRDGRHGERDGRQRETGGRRGACEREGLRETAGKTPAGAARPTPRDKVHRHPAGGRRRTRAGANNGGEGKPGWRPPPPASTGRRRPAARPGRQAGPQNL
ncbi:hypothetical protein BGLA2_1090010 [Burkholderia gladioli]|nr:hypothetical protein BGLA2_1090010 [Burkholderia gladioli]